MKRKLIDKDRVSVVYLMIYQLYPKSMSSLYKDWNTNNSYFGKYMGTRDQEFNKNIRILDVTGFMIFCG